MKKQDRKYVAVLVLAFLAAVAIEVFQPEAIDWTLSFERDDTRPYGSQVPYELLADLVPGADVTPVDLPPYLVLRDTTRANRTYLFITHTFAPDPAETEALLDFAARGNTVFIAASRFAGDLADTLDVHVDFDVVLPPFPLNPVEADTGRVHFVNPALRTAEGFAFRGLADDAFFSRFDTLRTTVLGVNAADEANYIRVEVGDGALFLSTLPLAFTNYYALAHEDAGYVARAWSYLPVQEVLWDAYAKPNRVEATTPLRFVLQEPALRQAYWVLVAFVLLFILFEAKRRQRIIPVIAPLRNTTVEFVKTVGRLYYQHGDHADLTRKKIAYFLDYVRDRLRLPTNTLDEDFRARLSERSGVPLDEVQALFATIAAVQDRPTLSEDDLSRLNIHIEAFYQKSQR